MTELVSFILGGMLASIAWAAMAGHWIRGFEATVDKLEEALEQAKHELVQLEFELWSWKDRRA